MKKLTKKIVMAVLIAAMVLSCFSGCKKENAVNADIATAKELKPEIIGDYSSLKLPIDDNYTKITVLVGGDDTTVNDTPVIKELRRRTGLNVELIPVPDAALANRTMSMLASKDGMTDIFGCPLSIDEQNDFGIQGAFAKVDEYIDELPNLKKIFYDEAEEHGTVNTIKNLTARDGHLYLFPVYNINRKVNHGLMYRKDIFDKHGITADWNGPEGFYNTLKKLKELYPDSVPFSVKLKTDLFKKLGESWGIGALDSGLFYDEADSKWKYHATDARYKEILDFVQKLYKEGLLDPEFMTITDAVWASKMTQQAKTFVTWDWIGRISMYKDQTKETVPGYDLRYGPAIGPTGKIIELSNSGGGSAIANNKNAELAMKLSDYIISESGAQLITLGIEGETYVMGDDGFAEYICLDEGETASINTLSEHGLFIPSLYRRFDDRSVYFKFTEEETEAQEFPEKFGKGFEKLDPVLTFTKEENELKTKILPDLNTAADEFSFKYILNGYGDKEWKEWLNKAKTLKADEAVKVYNDAQKRYNEL